MTFCVYHPEISHRPGLVQFGVKQSAVMFRTGPFWYRFTKSFFHNHVTMLILTRFCFSKWFLEETFSFHIYSFETSNCLCPVTTLESFRLIFSHTSSRNSPLPRFSPIWPDAMCDDVLVWTLSEHVYQQAFPIHETMFFLIRFQFPNGLLAFAQTLCTASGAM